MDVGADATRAHLVGESLGIDSVVLSVEYRRKDTSVGAPVIGTWGASIASKVGASVAAVAVLALQPGVGSRALVRVTDEHTEALSHDISLVKSIVIVVWSNSQA